MNEQVIWAILPIKDLSGGKSRLEGLLDRAERKRLIHAMAEDVLAALKGLSELSGIAVVTHDKDVRAWAQAHELTVIDDKDTKGLSEAVHKAAKQLEASGAMAILSVLCDTPLVTVKDFEDLLKLHNSSMHPSLTLAPSRDGDGSNAMIVCPPTAIAFHYGPGSAKAHKSEAAQNGLVFNQLNRATLGHDIDTEKDLKDLIRINISEKTTSKTSDFLTQSAITARLAEEKQ
jgi:2-phospho-L-lactate guanylyltransferase